MVAGFWILYYALFAGNAMCTLATVLEPVLEISFTKLIWFASGGVFLYCSFAGLMASSYSAVIQSFIMIIGGLILLPLCLKHEAVGGCCWLNRENRSGRLDILEDGGGLAQCECHHHVCPAWVTVLVYQSIFATVFLCRAQCAARFAWSDYCEYLYRNLNALIYHSRYLRTVDLRR